jgi:hypothetical protein
MGALGARWFHRWTAPDRGVNKNDYCLDYSFRVLGDQNVDRVVAEDSLVG